jgi:hypothetical protein
MRFFKRIMDILVQEKIEFDKPAVAELVKKHYPDFRRTLNELQRYSVGGKIDAGILLNQNDKHFSELVEFLKSKNFSGMRKWIGSNSDIDPQMIFHYFYHTENMFADQYLPSMILTAAHYELAIATVTDPQIQLAAFFTVLMSEAQWK